MISDHDGLLGFDIVINVAHERRCFASCTSKFKSSGLITCLECTSDLKCCFYREKAILFLLWISKLFQLNTN